jgi:hypothetical protein
MSLSLVSGLLSRSPAFPRYDRFAKRMTAAPVADVSAFVFLVRVRETHMCTGLSRGWLWALCCLVNLVYFAVDALDPEPRNYTNKIQIVLP